MELPKRKPTAADITVIAALILLIAFFAVRSFSSPDAEYFTVRTADTDETYSLSGSGSLSYVLNGISVNILYGEGSVRIAKSECPDGTCVRTGKISKAGESIVCVPAELVITIPHERAENSDEVYFVG